MGRSRYRQQNKGYIIIKKGYFFLICVVLAVSSFSLGIMVERGDLPRFLTIEYFKERVAKFMEFVSPPPPTEENTFSEIEKNRLDWFEKDKKKSLITNHQKKKTLSVSKTNNKSIKKIKPKPKIRYTKKYYIQIGAFRYKKNKDVFIKSVTKRGFYPRVLEEQSSSFRYRVVLGPFYEKREAFRIQREYIRKMRRLGIKADTIFIEKKR